MFLYCAYQAGIPLSFQSIFLFTIFTISAILITYSLYLLVGTASFWLINTNGLSEILGQLLQTYIQYPIHIYGSVIGLIFTFLIPIGFINYYTSAALLGKIESVMLNPRLGLLAPAVAVVFVMGAHLFWTFGLKHYKSTGT